MHTPTDTTFDQWGRPCCVVEGGECEAANDAGNRPKFSGSRLLGQIGDLLYHADAGVRATRVVALLFLARDYRTLGTVEEVAARHGVSKSALHRQIAFLRDKTGLKPQRKREKHTFRRDKRSIGKK
jgi:hypothetical protein